MEEKKQDNKVVWIVGAVMLILIILAFVPGLVENKQNLDILKQEEQLIKEGKVKTHDEVINEIIEILKERKQEKLEEYLADEFTYVDNDRNNSKYSSSLWTDLKYLVEDNYDIEKRANDTKNQETYRIYWNINKLVKERTDRLYCLQKITISLKRVVKQDIVTYEIEKIMLTDN